MTASDSQVILDLLGAVSNLTVHDGDVPDSDSFDKVIGADLPYLVFWPGFEDDSAGDSLAGTSGARLTDFRLTGVGETREQAQMVLEKARAVLNRKRATFATGSRFVRRTDNSGAVTRDDTWTRPGGDPLFSGIDQYEVLI